MNHIKTTLALLLFPLLSIAQLDKDKLDELLRSGSEEELVKESSTMLIEGYYYQAGLVVDKLLEKNPNSCNYNYRRGFIYLELSQDFIKAQPHLEKAVTDVDKNYDTYSSNEQSAPVDAIYHLARCYHLAENIAKAEENYLRFMDESSSKSEYVFLSKLGLEQVEIAKKIMLYPKKVKVINLGNTVNTDKPEFSPVISLDGSALYFTTRRGWDGGVNDAFIDPQNNLHPEDIYVSYRDFDGTWTDPQRMEFCDSSQNEATMAVSPDERRIYLYQDIQGNGDIFYSDFSTNRFQEVEHYEVKGVNTDSWEPHCTVTPDGLTMYFTSDRKGGFGGRDIYRVVKLADGEWSEPQNCGPTINGQFDEDSPFIAIDNKTLYYSSNGPKSMGGFDVFVAVLDENNAWSDPINLGYPTNSAGDDLYFTTTVDGKTGYLTSFRAGGFGEKDIYEIQNDYLGVKNLAVLKGKINTVDNEPLPEDVSITLRCTNCGDAFDRKIFPRIRDGVFLSTLEPCRTYEMIFSYEDGKKEFYTETFETACDKLYDEVYREVLLDTKTQEIVPPKDTTSIPVVVIKDYKNIEFKHLFGYNANKLTTKRGELKDFVKAVEQQLKDGREVITINIYSSASKVPTKTYKTNETLSQIRAENMKYDLLTYFQENTSYKDKINIVVVQVLVDGPEFEKDARNKKKYQPFQFVALKTQ